MIGELNLTLIMLAALIASISPGPATLAIANTSMQSGKRKGLAFASGVCTGSLMWSVGAALGLATTMQANAWILEVFRYVGAAYLIYLAYKSAKSALANNPVDIRGFVAPVNMKRAYLRGLALHLTNPKAILFFGSLYAVGVPVTASVQAIALMIACIFIQSVIVFHGYVLLFSSQPMVNAYKSLKRWFEAAFAIGLGYAGFKILTSRLS